MSFRFDEYKPATFCRVPHKPLQSIEHPGNIKNVGNAISSLGGHEKVASFLESREMSRSLGLRLNGQDPLERPVSSTTAKVDNLVLKITVPKWTGRKRKRGSNEPFKDSDDLKDGSVQDQLRNFLRSIRDNKDAYTVDAVGHVEASHRFRALPDFHTPFVSNGVLRNVQENVLPLDYDKIKNFRLNLDKRGPQPDQELVPPPFFTSIAIPYNYMYSQHVSLIGSKYKSKKSSVRKGVDRRPVGAQVIPYDSNDVPKAPMKQQPGLNYRDNYSQRLLGRLRSFLERRPITTRRAALNLKVTDGKTNLQHLASYVSFHFTSGPWRNALVLFGVDPRSDPKYRWYQTLTFRIGESDATGNKDYAAKYSQELEKSHIFDGQNIDVDYSSTWQICDITDPLVKEIFNVKPRQECEPKTDGWFHNGTIAKARVIMRDKIQLIRAGQKPTPERYLRIAGLPDDILLQEIDEITLDNASPAEMNLLDEFRSLLRETARLVSGEATDENCGINRVGSSRTTTLDVVKDVGNHVLPDIDPSNEYLAGGGGEHVVVSDSEYEAKVFEDETEHGARDDVGVESLDAADEGFNSDSEASFEEDFGDREEE